MSLRPLMILGCTSDAGKSLLVTAIGRWAARQGVDVAPFKAQNMSNNARVVDGGEIGVAQWLQALACGVEPTVDMNPVLLKPEADTRSQVIVGGMPRPDLTAMPWRDRSPHLWSEMEAAYHRLEVEHELIVIEGAGSPAEINLDDLVNLRVLEHSQAAGVLVVGIDRGGAFAHLYGTWKLVPDGVRPQLEGYILNRFRGDAGLLEPGPTDISGLTSMHNIGVLPMLRHALPNEEGGTIKGNAPPGAPSVGIVRAPYGSNLDEFHLLPLAAHTRWVTTPGDLDGVDIIILPGSKHVAADAAWMRKQKLMPAIAKQAVAGTRILGICGGAMLLGSRVDDPDGVEGATEGFGLLDVTTEMCPHKTAVRVTASLSGLPTPWGALNGIVASGYEIRNGVVRGGATSPTPQLWVDGNILATTIHGLLESPDVLEALTGNRPDPILDQTFDLLADAIEEHLDLQYLRNLIGT